MPHNAVHPLALTWCMPVPSRHFVVDATLPAMLPAALANMSAPVLTQKETVSSFSVLRKFLAKFSFRPTIS
jgi:hypothetical protein